MNKLYLGIKNAKEAFKNGKDSYTVLNCDDYKLSFFLDGWVGVKIELNKAAIIKYDLFSYHLDTEEIYRIVESLLNDLTMIYLI